jgi:sulfotransferase
MKSYYFLSGLPRSGSTLLSSILSQNELVYAGGNSPVCQLMWDMRVSVNTTSNQQILANNKSYIKSNLIRSIPHTYYGDIGQNIIVDKCRSWTIKENVDIIKNYITDKPKIIILIRPIEEIINSFCFLYESNGITINPESFLVDWSEPIMRSFEGIKHIIENEDSSNFLIISYNELVTKTSKVIDDIYKFFGWAHFEHNLTNIVNKYKENDSVYGLEGFHSVRPTIGIRPTKNYLSKDLLDKCEELNKQLYSMYYI